MSKLTVASILRPLLVTAFLSPVVATAAEEPAPPPLWENNAEASLLLTSGNTEVTTVGLGIGSVYRPDPWTAKAKAGFLTSKTTGVKTAESFDALLRGERKISDSLSGFLAGTYLKNEFSGFKDRLGAEAGLSYLIFAEGAHGLSAEFGLGLLKENLVTGPVGTSLGDRSFVTGRLGLDYKWKFSETAEFANNLSFLESFKTTQDWRLANTTSVTALMTEVLSLKLSFKVDYLNVPVTGKKSTDTATTVALVAKF